MARSTTALPEVRAVMSKPSRMGTPLEIKVPSVRVKRATAIFRISMPISGIFKTMVSIAMRPCGVPYHDFNANKPSGEEQQDDEAVDAADEVAQHDHDARGKRQVHTQAVEQRA